MAKPKLSTILWVLVTVVLIVIIVALANSLNDTKTALTQKEEELVALQSEKDSVEAELERTRQDKMDLEDKIYAMDMEISKLTDDLEGKSNEISELRGDLDQARVDLEETQYSLEREMQEKNALAVEVIKTKQDLETNQSILDEIRAAKEALEAKVKQLMAEKEVALERIVVTPEAEPLQSAVELEGEVLVVNRDFNFVVIDLGKQNGIQVGMKFDVYKDGEVVGQVEVEKIYDTMAAATILSETKKGIAKGREVRSI